jgi:hypothetical protein
MNFFMLRKIFFICLLFSSIFSSSQVGIGHWRSHTAGHQGFLIDQSASEIFLSHGNSMMVYDKETGEIQNWNSVNSLTDSKITALKYDQDNQILFLGYENGNLDLIKNNTVYNLPAIRLSNIIGLKSIQNFVFKNGLAYVCTGFGIVVVNPNKFEVKETYYPTANNYFVYDLDFYNGRIYVSTENGIYSGLENNPLLPAPGAWTALSGIDNGATYKVIETHGTRLMFIRDESTNNGDTLFYLENNVVTQNPLFPPGNYTDLNDQNDTLMVCQLGALTVFDTSLSQIENIFQYPFDPYPQVMGAVKVGLDYWTADIVYGMVRARNSWSAVSYNSGGPFRTGAYKLDWADGKLGMTAGFINSIGNSSFNQNGVNLFDEEEWVNFHRSLNPILDQDTIYDFTSIAINPENKNQVYIGTSSGGGLFEITDGQNIAGQYTELNSALQKRSNFEDYYVLSDMSYDYDGNLWIANSFCSEQLVCRAADNNWYSYDLGSAGKNILLYELFVDYYNLKWIGTRANGIIVYDDNGTLDDPNDDRTKVISTAEGNGALPNGEVTCMTMDFDEEIWIGTTAGLSVIYSPQNIWEGEPGEYDAQRILVERDGFVEILLGETPITDIEVDGANRKWVATQGSGVFLLSEDGTEEIHHFSFYCFQ